MGEADAQTGGQYHWSGWTVAGVSYPDLAVARLTRNPRVLHRQLDDTTSFGDLVGVCASLALVRPDCGWERLRDRLQAMSEEFGARWFEAAVHEDQLLKRAVVVDTDLFEEESAHMDVVLTHFILEVPVVGTGSWNA